MSTAIVILLFFVHCSSEFYINVANNTRDVSDLLGFRFYEGPSPSDYTVVSLIESNNRTLFNPNKNMEFFMPDWREPFSDITTVQNTFGSAFFRRNETFVSVDYLVILNERNNFDNPINIASNINNIANALANFFRRVIPMMLNPSRVHFICHGSGCSILSQMARSYRPARMMWITGLDPVNRFIPNLSGHLSRSDGMFVDIIHTDAGFLGDALSSGTVDFFPNSGSRPQPACHLSNDANCNHDMAWRYYVESITNPGAFPSRRCLPLPICTINLYNCPCDISNNFANMGFGVNRTTARGDYYLQTNKKSPYSKGTGGTKFGTPSVLLPP